MLLMADKGHGKILIGPGKRKVLWGEKWNVHRRESGFGSVIIGPGKDMGHGESQYWPKEKKQALAVGLVYTQRQYRVQRNSHHRLREKMGCGESYYRARDIEEYHSILQAN